MMVMRMETERGCRGAKCGREGCEVRRGWVLRVLHVCFNFWGFFSRFFSLSPGGREGPFEGSWREI